MAQKRQVNAKERADDDAESTIDEEQLVRELDQIDVDFSDLLAVDSPEEPQPNLNDQKQEKDDEKNEESCPNAPTEVKDPDNSLELLEQPEEKKPNLNYQQQDKDDEKSEESCPTAPTEVKDPDNSLELLEQYVKVDEPESILLQLQEQVPSAPVFDEAPLLIQPNVSSAVATAPSFASAIDTAMSDMQKINRMNDYFVNIAKMKPLTGTELDELYCNPFTRETEMVEQDFVEVELHREHLSEKHILYELLLKYARSRQNIKINLLDINEAKVNAKKLYSQLWVESTQCVKGSKKCQDNVRCNVQHYYP